MTRLRSQTHLARTPDDYYELRVVNESTFTAPAYAVLQLLPTAPEILGRALLRVTRPTGDPRARLVVNGPTPIGPGGKGQATQQTPVPVSVSGNPTLGDDWGPVGGSWVLSAGGTGFTALGGASGSVALFGRTAGESGVDHPIVQIVSTEPVPLQQTGIVQLVEPADELVASPFDFLRLPRFKRELPTQGRPFAVLLTPLVAASQSQPSVADAAVTGCVACLVDVRDVLHERADCENENPNNLISGETGRARILWRSLSDQTGDSRLGVQLCLVMLDNAEGGDSGAKMVAIIETIGGGEWVASRHELSPDGLFDCPVMERQGSGVWQWDGQTIVTVEATFTTGITVAEGKARLAIVNLIDGGWVVVNADCGEVDWP